MEDANKFLSDKEYEYVFSHAPRVCIDLVIKTEQGIILSKRDITPNKGKWHCPGGRVFYKESIAKAIERISESELGIRVRRERLLGFLEYRNDGKYVHSVTLVFLVTAISKSFRGSDQANKVKVFSFLPTNMIAQQKRILQKITLKSLLN